MIRIVASSFIASLCVLAATPSSAQPSRYEPEPISADVNKKTKACAHWTKGICQTYTGSGWTEAEMNQGASFVGIVSSCKFPAANPGKWASLSKQAVKWLEPAKGDVAFIPASEQWEKAESSDGSVLRCVDLHWYERESEVTMSKCGHPDEAVVCEASGSKSAKAINLAHFRVDEATKLKSSDKEGCKEAALQAVAFSRGLPKFKASLGSNWGGGLTYKTRYDGVLSEKAMFAKMKQLGDQATALYKSCGGGAPKTTDADEMAFRGE